MDKLKNLLTKISSLPVIGRVLSIIIMVLICVVIFFFLPSCGASRSTVRVYNRADSTETTISVSNGDGGTTSVTVSPKIQIDSTNILSK